MLTREQVEKLIPLTTMDRHIVNIDGHGWIGIFSALRVMIDTDAALREQLTQVTQEW